MKLTRTLLIVAVACCTANGDEHHKKRSHAVKPLYSREFFPQPPEYVRKVKEERFKRMGDHLSKMVSNPYTASYWRLIHLRDAADKHSGKRSERPFGWIEPPLDDAQKEALGVAVKELTDSREASRIAVRNKLSDFVDKNEDTEENTDKLREEYLKLFNEAEAKFTVQYDEILLPDQQQFVAETALRGRKLSLAWVNHRWITNHFDISDKDHTKLKKGYEKAYARLSKFWFEQRDKGVSTDQIKGSPAFESSIYGICFDAMQGLSEDQVRQIWTMTGELKTEESWKGFYDRQEPHLQRNLAKYFAWFEAE